MNVEKVLALFAIVILVLLIALAGFNVGYVIGQQEGGERTQARESFAARVSLKTNDADRFKVCHEFALQIQTKKH
jgi:hypothetical protein